MKYLYLLYVAIRTIIIVFGVGGVVLFFISPKFLGLTFISAAALLTLKIVAIVAGIITAWLRTRRVIDVNLGG